MPARGDTEGSARTRPGPGGSGLLRRLWIDPPADHGFAALGSMCDLWADEFEEKTAKDSPRLDPGLAREAITLFRELPATAEREVLLCTDLHAGNVLAAEREPGWSSTPSPTSATRPTTPFSTCSTATSGSTPIPVALVARMADLLTLDPRRLLLWLFARCVQESPEWAGLADVAVKVAPR